MAATPFIASILGLDGAAVSGGLLFSYTRGTTTPASLYSDVGLTVPTTNPIVANANGQLAFYFDNALSYTWTAKTADRATTLWSVDVVSGALTVTYLNPAYEVSPFNRPETYGAVGDGVRKTSGVATASSTAFTDASGVFTADDEDKTIVLIGGGLDVVVVGNATVASGGSGYVVGDTLTIAGGTGTASTWTVQTVDGSGAVTSIFPVGFGAYSAAPSTPNSATGGTGTSVSLTLTNVSCPTSHATTIAARLSDSAITLASAPAKSVATCEYYYGTNDSVAFQTCIDSLLDGGSVVVQDRIYIVGNMKWPHLNDTSNKPSALVCLAGSAELVFAAVTDTAYGFAPKRWITATKTSFSSSPFYVENVIFNGAFMVDYTVVTKNWATEFHDCTIKGAKKVDVLQTRQNQDASAGATGSYQAECGFYGITTIDSKAQLAGFYNQGTAADDTDASTDGYFVDVNINCNSITPFAALFGDMGGWKYDGGHTYASSFRDVYAKKLSNLGSWANATHEDLVTIGKVGTKIVTIGRNNFWEGVEVLYTADTSAESLVIGGLTTSTSRDVTEGQVFVRTSKANKALIINDLTSRSATPVVITDQGTVLVNFGRDANGEIGLRYYDNGATVGPQFYIDRVSASPANADIGGSLVWRGMNDAGTVTNYGFLTLTFGTVTAAAESASMSVQLRRSGANTVIFGYGAGLYVGAGASDPGTGSVNITGDYQMDGNIVIYANAAIGHPSFTSATLNSIANAVNTANKAAGNTVYNSTAGKLVSAVGSTAGSVWVDGAGTTVNTPV